MKKKYRQKLILSQIMPNSVFNCNNIFQDTPEFWKEAAEIANPELICLRELLEFKSDWNYAILKGNRN